MTSSQYNTLRKEVWLGTRAIFDNESHRRHLVRYTKLLINIQNYTSVEVAERISNNQKHRTLNKK